MARNLEPEAESNMTPDPDPGNVRIDRKHGGVILIRQGKDEVVVMPADLPEVAHVLMNYALDRIDFEHHIESRRRPSRSEAPVSDAGAPQTSTSDPTSGSDRHG